jgi:hypothetical protein
MTPESSYIGETEDGHIRLPHYAFACICGVDRMSGKCCHLERRQAHVIILKENHTFDNYFSHSLGWRKALQRIPKDWPPL